MKPVARGQNYAGSFWDSLYFSKFEENLIFKEKDFKKLE
jgi:hypothetical protein